MEKKINSEIFNELQKLLHKKPTFCTSVIPYRGIIDPNRDIFKKRGLELISEGKVGCLVVAGGQGTRLAFDGPKGCFPITPVTHKTLFQLFAERLHAASIQNKRLLKMAIMTSPENHAAVLAHFISHDFFGCEAQQIAFFQQTELPFLNLDGEPIFKPDGQIASGPDGNGSSISAFFDSPIAKAWEDEEIHYVTFNPIDNPLADPFDPYLIGAHALNATEVTMKCIKREDPEEHLGLVVDIKGKPRVIEYMEAPKEIWEEQSPSGELIYSIGNISLFCFSFSFLAHAAKQKMPLHKNLKKNVWKFERFIFDILNFSHHAQVLLYPRNHCFAPLKNQSGKSSPSSVRSALSSMDREMIGAITGKPVPATCLEIDPLFHYPTESLLNKWRGKEIPNTPYVDS